MNEHASRRRFFRDAGTGALALAAGAWLPAAAAPATPPPAQQPAKQLTPDEALARLKKGNRNWLAGKSPLAGLSGRERRLELAQSQSPFVVMVACSDSRVPPELLFASGLGELFIVRNAGNTVDTVALGSIEYAVHVLGVPLVVVLGHERCGAVGAAMAVVQKNAVFPGSLGQTIEPIVPAVLQAKTRCDCEGDALLDASVRENVNRVVARLKSSEPVLIDPLQAGRLKIVGARYDLDDGEVEFFEDQSA